METFIVEVREVHISHREVQAEDHTDAVARVVEGEGEEVFLEYSDTRPVAEWAVKEKGGLDKPTLYHNPATDKFDKKCGL